MHRGLVLFAAAAALAEAGSVVPYSLSPVFTSSETTAPVRFTWKLRGDGEGGAEETILGHELSIGLAGSSSASSVLFALNVTGADPFHSLSSPPSPGLLAPGRTYAWRARVRTASSTPSPWSAPAPLHVGPASSLSSPSWGGATFLCTSPSAATDLRSSTLRRDFTLPPGTIVDAVAYAVGLGEFVFHVNGNPVAGAEAAAPGQTTWSKRVLYSSYTVPASSLTAGGANTVGFVLGNGMYNVPDPSPRYTKWTGSYGPRMALLLLVVTYQDGSTFTLTTEPTTGAWTATDGGPITFSHMYAGEDFNATLAVPGWDAPSFSPSANPLVAWAPAQNCTSAYPGGALLPSAFDPILVMETLPAVNMTPSAAPGGGQGILVDVGRNFAGFATVTVEGLPSGTGVRVWPSETMRDGVIDQSSGGTPMFWSWFPNASASGSAPQSVTLAPTFSTYGWRWLAVETTASSQPSPPSPPAPPTPGPYNGTLTVLSASYGLNCNPSLAGDETAAVAAWCGSGTKTNCSFAVCVCGDNTCAAGSPPCLPDPADNCAKDFAAVWSCSGDPAGTNRSWYIPAEADNQVFPLTCGPMPPRPPAPNVTSATGHFFRSSVPVVGTWASSNEWVSRIHNITVEAILSNLHSVLRDCPHRERLGWLEVSHLMFPSIAYNVDISRLWSKISMDTVDSQLPDTGMIPDIAPEYTVFSGGFRDSPEWGSAGILNPAWLFAWYGDDAVLNLTYTTGKKYLDYLLSQRGPDGLLAYGLGDWIPVVPSPNGVTATGILVQDLHALAAAAAALGRDGDAANFTALASEVGAAFEAAFWNASGASYPTQCTAGFALANGITPAENQAAAYAALVADVVGRGNVTTSGEVGNRYAFLSLAQAQGGLEAFWASLLRTDAPGYGWMLTMGETALAETWYDSSSSSHIHAMYGHLDEIFYAYIAGIRQLPPAAAAGARAGAGAAVGFGSPAAGSAWRRVLVAPAVLPELDWVNATFDSPRGLITVHCRVEATGSPAAGSVRVEVHAQVPPGVEGWVELPLSKRRERIAAGMGVQVFSEVGKDPRGMKGRVMKEATVM